MFIELLNNFSLFIKRQDSAKSTFKTDGNVYPFFISSFEVCIYMQYFLDVGRNQTSKKKCQVELIKTRLIEELMVRQFAYSTNLLLYDFN